MKILLILYQAMVSRIAGGGIWTSRPPALSEALFSLPIAYAALLGDKPATTVFIFVWTYLFFQTGHGTAFHMGADPQVAQSGRKEFLSRVIDPLCRFFGVELGTPIYCWLFMGLKGGLVHIFLGIAALPMLILWPLAYFIGNRIVPKFWPTFDGEVVAELMAGFFSGVAVFSVLQFKIVTLVPFLLSYFCTTP